MFNIINKRLRTKFIQFNNNHNNVFNNNDNANNNYNEIKRRFFMVFFIPNIIEKIKKLFQ